MTITELYELARQNGYENFSISIERYDSNDRYVCIPLSATDTAITVENRVVHINI